MSGSPIRRRRQQSILWRVVRVVSWSLFGAVMLAILVPLGVLMFQAFTARQPAPPDVIRSMQDVHDLAIDPLDGALYAATRRGLFKVVAADEALWIATSYRENAGLIAVGPGEFLASGRPDLRDLVGDWEPEMMGLQRSTNSGHNWHAVSLKGKASFSVLVARHTLLYGFERGANSFMVSDDDGRSWENRSTTPPLLDFAVSPIDESAVVAVTEDALLESVDGGRSWQQGDGPNELRFLEWSDAGPLWSLDAEGNLFSRSDAGEEWQRRGQVVGQPEAFLATDGALYAAIHGDGIFASHDGGETWQLVYRNPDESGS